MADKYESPTSFRLAIDLTCLFDDDRSWCYIYVEPQTFSAISDLEAHLQHLFGIQPPVRLFVGKYLLPSSESIKIICIGDVIRVVGGNSICKSTEISCANVKKTSTEENSGSSQISLTAMNTSPVSISSHAGVCENGMMNSCAQVAENINGAAAVTSVVNQTATHRTPRRNTSPEVAETNGEMKQPTDMFVDKLEENIKEVCTMDGMQSNISTEVVPSDVDVDTNVVSGIDQKKRKRTRHRKRKSMLSSSVGEAVSLIRSAVGMALPVFNNEKCYVNTRNRHADSKHIRFSEDGDGDTSMVGDSDSDVLDTRENSSILSNRNLQNSNVKTVSNWDVKRLSDSATPTQNFVNLLSLRNKAVPVVFERKQAVSKTRELSTTPASRSESITKQKTDNFCVSANESVMSKVNLDPNDYPLLNSAPNKNDVILFKTLVLTENCIPQFSSYITATVLDFCTLSQDVQLRITRNGHELRQQPLKFMAEVQTDLIEDDITTINWNEIHETRLVSRAM